jgi:hypothetical protein
MLNIRRSYIQETQNTDNMSFIFLSIFGSRLSLTDPMAHKFVEMNSFNVKIYTLPKCKSHVQKHLNFGLRKVKHEIQYKKIIFSAFMNFSTISFKHRII